MNEQLQACLGLSAIIVALGVVMFLFFAGVSLGPP